MKQSTELNIALKFAEIDNQPFPNEQEGWVSGLINRLTETLAFYFRKPVHIHHKTETEAISEEEFKALDAIICVLSPAFMLSSNLAKDVTVFEKAFSFNIDFINSKIHKVLKGPINFNELPATIAMGTFHHFYQTNSSGDSGYETIFEWDNAAVVRAKYWESLSNLIFDLLKNLEHEKWERFMPPSEHTVYLGSGDIAQLWNRTNLYGELRSRGVKVLPDHDHSIEVKYLNDPVKFYLEKCTLAIHFPEEFLPLTEKAIKDLTEMSSLKRFIWFNPEVAKNGDKKKQYDELRLKLKNLSHVEAITSGIEELKEIVFSRSEVKTTAESTAVDATNKPVYLILAQDFDVQLKNRLLGLLRQNGLNPLILDGENIHQKRVKHYQYLKESEYCLICYDGRNPAWISANINEVKKAAGLNPDKNQKIKLGIISESTHLRDLETNDQSYTLLAAPLPGFEEDLNRFVHE